MTDKGWSGARGKPALLVLAAASLMLSACGGEPDMREAAYPTLDARAPKAEALKEAALAELIPGKRLTWRDSRKDVAFRSTVSYAADGSVSGSWQNADTGRDGEIDGRWDVRGDRLCVSYAVKADDASGNGLTCYAVYRQDRSLYLVGAGNRLFETANLPAPEKGSGEMG